MPVLARHSQEGIVKKKPRTPLQPKALYINRTSSSAMEDPPDNNTAIYKTAYSNNLHPFLALTEDVHTVTPSDTQSNAHAPLAKNTRTSHCRSLSTVGGGLPSGVTCSTVGSKKQNPSGEHKGESSFCHSSCS